MCFHNIGVISDSHDNARALEEALMTFEDYEVEQVVHCGDITEPESIELFKRLIDRQGVGVHFVLGNCDRMKDALEERICLIGAFCHFKGGEIEWRGKKIFFTHGHIDRSVDDAIASEEYDLVCSGHTHIFKEEMVNGKTLCLNPGALSIGSYCILSQNLEVAHLYTDGFMPNY